MPALVFTTMNRTTFSRIFAVEVAERFLNLLPRGTHEWEKFITVEEMTLDLREVKFFVEDVKVRDLPYQNSFLQYNFIGP